MTAKIEQAKPKIFFCDCGQIAYKRDGSGWFCQDCESWLATIGKLLQSVINEQRGVNPEEVRIKKREYWRRYNERNHHKILIYQREKYYRRKALGQS